ncbi:flagellar basal body P-ring protein FlgI [Ectothiorhodospiraceae bacterium BW-2]|nr:flagellar basal body P-ring protein FlgI [Ectothiorhodospiraceae bacterium BW-2]
MRAIPILLLLLLPMTTLEAGRLKDLATIAGVRDNQLLGYGLVVGLDGSGDKGTVARESLRSIISQLGMELPAGVNPDTDNVAAVMVNATLRPFTKPGQTIDVTVSSIGKADSLRGGTLLMTPLKGVDGNIYAVAQGNLVVSGFGAEGADGSRISVNHQSVGRVPNGATVERAVPTSFNQGKHITYNLRNPDFTTANTLVETINGMLGAGTAVPIDASSIRISAPVDPTQRVSFISLLENMSIEPAEASAKVIVNSRTGTVIISKNVRVMPAAITHGSMTVTIKENQEVVPGIAGNALEQDTEININTGPKRMFNFQPGVDLNDIVRAVNQVGAAPGDLMAILEALKEAGALRAELIVI